MSSVSSICSGPGKPLRVLIEADRLSSVILWGPPGTGKTTIARLVAGATEKAFEPLSAVTAGVKDVREIAERARARMGEHGRGTILFLDEVHRFNRTQQDALLPHVEEGLFVLIGATTENPFFSLTGPAAVALDAVPARATRSRRPARAAAARARPTPTAASAISTSPSTTTPLDHLVDRAEGDARHALTSLEVAAALASESGRDAITLGDAEAALALRALRYGDDEHYDVLSAFIKSIRGSDVDAGLYWLARMVEAGEDPRLIARRLVILASEDVGMADPQGLVVADAAARAVEFVGHARGAAQPRARGRVPRDARPSRTRRRWRCGPRRPTCATARPGRSPGTSGTPVTLARRSSGTARGTCTRTTSPGAGWSSSTAPTATWSGTGVPTGHGADVDRRPGSTHRRRRGRRIMSGEEWAAIVGAQICLVALVVLVVMIVRLDRAAKELRGAARDFRRESGPLLDELRQAIRDADYELDRVDAIVSGAERGHRSGRRRIRPRRTARSPARS